MPFVFRIAGFSGAVLFSINLYAQDCSPADITLENQAQIDQFQTNHGPCARVAGNLFLGPEFGQATFTDLDALNGISEVGGELHFRNAQFGSITGLSNLAAIGGHLRCLDATGIVSFNALSSLGSIGAALADAGGGRLIFNDCANLQAIGVGTLSNEAIGVIIDGDSMLTVLNDWPQPTTVITDLVIQSQALLTSVAGLPNVMFVSIEVIFNSQLMSLDLSGLNPSYESAVISIQQNSKLSSLEFPALTGLQSLTLEVNGEPVSQALVEPQNNGLNLDSLVSLQRITEGLIIALNPGLADCSGLVRLLDDIDHGEPGPGPPPGYPDIPDVQGQLAIGENAQGCNSVEEIFQACSAVVLSVLEISDEQSHTGCPSVTIGPDFLLTPTGILNVTASEWIKLEPEILIQNGATLGADIEPIDP